MAHRQEVSSLSNFEQGNRQPVRLAIVKGQPGAKAKPSTGLLALASKLLSRMPAPARKRCDSGMLKLLEK
jgi:hypothetical protein